MVERFFVFLWEVFVLLTPIWIMMVMMGLIVAISCIDDDRPSLYEATDIKPQASWVVLPDKSRGQYYYVDELEVSGQEFFVFRNKGNLIIIKK